MTDRQLNIIPVGSTLIPCWGAYSDAFEDGPFIVLKEIDRHAVVNAFVAAWNSGKIEREARERISCYGFVVWLHSEGYIEDTPNSTKWDLGAYEFEPAFEDEIKP